MYLPASFSQGDVEAQRGLLHDRPFATLVTVADGEPFASHVPLLRVEDGSRHGSLWGHVARANPQWRHFDGPASTLAIFTGPHAYVSPTAYVTEGQVPTWNYAVVHAVGRPRVLDAERARVVLAALVLRFEGIGVDGEPDGDASPPWSLATLPEGALDAMLRAIVAFEMPIERLEAKWKVGQNREQVDRLAAADALAAQGDPDARAVAALMRAVDRRR